MQVKNKKVATRQDFGQFLPESVLDVTYALMQQLVPGETLAPQKLAMGQTYEQLDKGEQGRLGKSKYSRFFNGTFIVLHFTVLYCPVLCYPVSSRPVLPCSIFYCMLSYTVLSLAILSCPVLNCTVLQCPVLSYHVLSCTVL